MSGQLFIGITQIPPPESGVRTPNSSRWAQWSLSSRCGPMRAFGSVAPPSGMAGPVCLAVTLDVKRERGSI